MKINKFFLGLLGITAMIMASCSSDDEYEWATVSGPQVFFSSDAADNYEINPKATSFNVPIFRQNTSGAQTVNLKSTVANPMYSVPASVTFNDGEAETVVPVSYDPAKIEYGRYDSLTIVINDQNITTPWGMSAYTFTAGVTDWGEWGPWNASGTAVFYYNGYWSGVDKPQKFEYRHNLITTNLYQFKIYNWGSGTELVFDYDEATGNVSCAPQFAVNNASYGDVTVSDAAHYAGVRGWDDYAGGKPTGYFDKEQGIIACQMAYFVSAGYFAYGDYEYIYIDGYNRADLSTEAAYAGKFIDPSGSSFVVANVTLGPDVQYANVALVEGKDVSEEVLQQIVEGTYQPLQQVTESGEVRFAADELADGKYTIVVVPFYEEEARVDNASTATFTFTASSEAETWSALYVGDYLYGATSYNQDGSFFYDDSPFTDQATLYQSDKDGSRYKIAPWCNSEEDGLIFTMDEEGTITVEECPTGHTSSYGDILASDIVTYGAADIPSYYKDGVFHFSLVFHVPAGVYSYQEDTFTLTGNAAKALKAAQAKKQSKESRSLKAKKQASNELHHASSFKRLKK